MYTDQVELRSQNSLTLVTPRIRTTYGKSCFNHAAPSLWNEFHSNRREAKIISTLKDSFLSSPL